MNSNQKGGNMNKSDNRYSSHNERGTASSELFRLRNVETQLGSNTKHYVGDLVFTDRGVSLVQRARYTNLWGVLKGNPMSLLYLFGPAALPCAIAGGAIVFFSTGDEEAFDVGGIAGAVLSIPLSIWVISRINRRSQKNANDMLEKLAQSDPTLTSQTTVGHISRENLQQIIYDPGEQTLRLAHKYGAMIVSIPYDEWEKGSEQASSYVATGRS